MHTGAERWGHSNDISRWIWRTISLLHKDKERDEIADISRVQTWHLIHMRDVSRNDRQVPRAIGRLATVFLVFHSVTICISCLFNNEQYLTAVEWEQITQWEMGEKLTCRTPSTERYRYDVLLELCYFLYTWKWKIEFISRSFHFN